MDNCKIVIDREKKLVKAVWSGKPNIQAIEEGLNTAENVIRQFKPGECLFYSDTTAIDFRFLPAGADKLLNESNIRSIAYAKKVASVVTSLMLEMSLGKVMYGDNFKMFDTAQKAEEWLLNK